MIRLARTLDAWGTPKYNEVLKEEVQQLGTAQLPLQQGLSATSYEEGDKFDEMIIGASEAEGGIRIKAGIFYTGIISGCSCADDPTPVEPQGEYCEVQFDIDRTTAATMFAFFSVLVCLLVGCVLLFVCFFVV